MKTFKINNSIYSIHLVSSNNNNLREQTGLINPVTKEIFVDMYVPNAREILIHELSHAMIEEYLPDVTWNEENVALFFGKYFDKVNAILKEIEDEL